MRGTGRRLGLLAAAALAMAGLIGTVTASAAVHQVSRANAVPAGGLAADALTGTWQAQSDLDSTGSPQPLPTTTADCGNWSGGEAVTDDQTSVAADATWSAPVYATPRT